MTQTQLTLFKGVDLRAAPDDWTFIGAATRELTHCYHDYPARMIPQVAGKLFDLFAAGATWAFDPYCGSGTSLVEGLIRGVNVVGTDLNPLARLITQAKTAVPNAQKIERRISQYRAFVAQSKPRTLSAIPEVPGISRVDFWFKPAVVEKLLRLKGFVDDIEDGPERLFFQVALSETVRESSNTRNEEFKLYRYDAERLSRFSPDVFEIMGFKLNRNWKGLKQFLPIVHNFAQIPAAHIYDFNTVFGCPPDIIAPASVDIVITSPPYGDSQTTVAYGQYSRLSAAWLGLPEPDKIDRKLMGGKAAKDLLAFASEKLNQAVQRIALADNKRALEVASFYADLRDSVGNVAQLIKPGGYACYVVGNRKVKGVNLPTDDAIRCFFEASGFEHIKTFHRSIPNKRMPLQNSPTNVTGALDATMTQEYIVVMRRKEQKAIKEKRNRNGSLKPQRPIRYRTL